MFLTINGLILLAGERLRRSAETRALVQEHAHHTDPGYGVGRDLDTLTPFAIYSLVFGMAMIFYTTLS